MNYNEVTGPNSLAEFLLEGLSDETLLRLYKEKRHQMDIADTMTDDPIELLKEHISALYYTAGYNMLRNTVESHVTQSEFDELMGR